MSERASTDVSDDEILAVFANRDKSPLRPPDVAEDLPISIGDLRDRFDDLGERDLLRNDPDRQSGTAWYLTPDGAERIDVPEAGVVTDVEAQATATGSQSLPRDQETTETQPPEPGETTVGRPDDPPTEAVESFDPPGTADDRAERRAALRAAYEYLRERGIVHRSEFRVNVFPEATGGYESPNDGWWEDVVGPGLESLPGPQYDDEDDVWRFDHAAARPPGE